MPELRPSHPLEDRELLDLFGDDPEALALLDAVAATQHARRSSRLPRALRATWNGRVRVVVLAASAILAALAAVAFVGPAFGLYGRIIDFGNAPRANGRVVADFSKLALAESGSDPGVVAGKTRVVYTFATPNGAYPVYATPAHAGFCWGVRGIGVTCVNPNSPRLEPFYTDIPRPGSHEPSLIAAASRAPVSRAILTFEDGSRISLPLVTVGAPINAVFLLYDVPPGHWHRGTRPAYITVYGPAGHPAGTGRLLYQTAR